MILRLIALACALTAAAPAQAADGGLLSTLVGRTFVVPDGRATPVNLTFAAPAVGVVEVRVAGIPTERYAIRGDGTGEYVNTGAPDLISKATFDPRAWSRTYKGLTITYALSPEGDLLGRLSGALEPWQSGTFVYALAPGHADLDDRLQAMLEQRRDEAERYEGHAHEH